MVEAGEIEFAPCHEHSSVGPMAGVTTASMKVYQVKNITHDNVAYSNLNEGYGKVLRYGAYSGDVITKLHWMNDVLAAVLSEALANSENGIDIRQWSFVITSPLYAPYLSTFPYPSFRLL
jgi:hypothetical protein